MDRASDHLEATLAPRGGSRLKLAASWVVTVFGSVTGMSDATPPVDLVVRRKATGAEVFRTKADVGSPELLLEEARADLHSMSVEEFVDEWSARPR